MTGTIKTNSKSSHLYHHRPKSTRRQEWYEITKRLISMSMVEDAKQAFEFYQSYGGTRDFNSILAKCIKPEKRGELDV